MKTCGLYIVRGVEGENGAIINHVKNIDYNEKIDDTLLFDKIVMDDVHICMYECNITNAYLMSSNILPMVYANIVLQSQFKTILLYSLYICFKIRDIDKIKCESDLIGSKIRSRCFIEWY